MKFSNLYRRVTSKLLYKANLSERLRDWDDDRYLKLLFRLRMGRRLNLADPQTFSEKLQWLKLHDRRAIYTTMVDKFDVKAWVSTQIGEEYVVPNLGVWDSFEGIDFDTLPETFVLKCTHDSGGLVICSDRSTFDVNEARRKINRSLGRNYFALEREWPYRDVKPRVLAEVYLPSWSPIGESAVNGAILDDDRDSDGIIDYKFYCFHGEPMFLYVSQGLHDHSTARMDFLTLDWEKCDFTRSDYWHFSELPVRPRNFESMIEIARDLARGIPFARVDLFEHEGRILFSEMTLHPVSGMMPIDPESADREIGKLLDLSRVTWVN